MRNLIFLAAAVLLGLGIFFARDRLKRAFQLGAILYALVLVGRFVFFGMSDSDTLLDMLTLIAVFFLVWLVAWGVTHLILRSRRRADGPPR
jgi:hypothetical protein